DVSEKADIYALGAILFTMLTGSAPPTGPGAGPAEGEDLRRVPAPVRALRPAVPASLEQFVMQAMERQPERRQSAEEFIEGLRDLAASVIAEPATGSAPAIFASRAREASAARQPGPKRDVTAPPAVWRPADFWQSCLDGWRRLQAAASGSRHLHARRWSRRPGGRTLAVAGLARPAAWRARLWGP